MNGYPLVSVIIATFNSSKLLPRTLSALTSQSYPKDRMEILAIDGGSTDDTIDIAKQYGCKVIHNPETEPVHAKVLGIQNAKGKYLMVLDHDEVLVNADSIKKRVVLLEEHPACKVAFCSGYKRPDDYPLLNEYISEYGDPFSLFVYNFSKGYRFLAKELKSIGKVKKETKSYLLVSFAETRHMPIFELCCLATIIDTKWFKSHSNIAESPQDMAHMFYIMLSMGYPEVIYLKKDPLVHYSADSIKAFFPKLKWRIRNNVHFANMSENGFSGRQKYIRYSRYKKYLFIPYTAILPICVVHGVYMAIIRRNPVFLMHPIFCWYVLLQIMIEFGKKIAKRTPEFTSYDGKKVIDKGNI